MGVAFSKHGLTCNKALVPCMSAAILDFVSEITEWSLVAILFYQLLHTAQFTMWAQCCTALISDIVSPGICTKHYKLHLEIPVYLISLTNVKASGCRLVMFVTQVICCGNPPLACGLQSCPCVFVAMVHYETGAYIFMHRLRMSLLRGILAFDCEDGYIVKLVLTVGVTAYSSNCTQHTAACACMHSQNAQGTSSIINVM
jgi:hypothetical protein